MRLIFNRDEVAQIRREIKRIIAEGGASVNITLKIPRADAERTIATTSDDDSTLTFIWPNAGIGV